MSIIHVDQVDPKTIIIRRDERQRRMVPLDDDFVRSISKRIINPIVVNEIDGQFILMAGERRLTAALQLNLPLVPIRRFDNLTPAEAQIIELEENVKRIDLPWRDMVRAVGDIHKIFSAQTESWKISDTAEEVHLSQGHTYKILHVYAALDSDKLSMATGIENAYNILIRMADRIAESVVNNIIIQGTNSISEIAPPPTASPPPQGTLKDIDAEAFGASIDGEAAKISAAVVYTPPPQVASVPPPAVECTNFVEWSETYSGPKFNFIHCDFPYGTYKGDNSTGTYVVNEFYDNKPDDYLRLLTALCKNLNNLMSHSAHMLFWFDMKFYTETVQRLSATGITVHPHPLIWHKTAGGVMPGNSVSHPRRTYDTALLCVRGNRPFVKPGMCSYAAPPVHSKVHPSQKPEPMLRFFFQMFVDGNTVMLDPTCGSASALKAAEDLGAKSVLGLELDKDYAAQANSAVLSARILRMAGR